MGRSPDANRIGLRRRGVPATAIRDFIGRLGVTKADGLVEMSYLENTIREHLNQTARRRMAVLDPVKLVIENYPEGQTEELEAVNNPADENSDTRMVPFGRELWVERDDYMDDAPKKFRRLTIGREVRLRFAYFVTCTDVIKDDAGNVTEIRCTYDPDSRGGDRPMAGKFAARSIGRPPLMRSRPRSGCTTTSSPQKNPARNAIGWRT